MKNLRYAVYAALIFAGGMVAAIAQDANSPLLQLLLMGSGLHSNDWGAQTNINLTKLENAIAGVTSVVTTGGGTTLTSTQARYQTFKVSGALGSNATITFPATARSFTVYNGTSGNYTLTIKCSGGGAGPTVEQGKGDKLFCDGTDVFSSSPIDKTPVGAMLNYAGASPPTDYANCDGAAVSRATYSALYTLIGTTYGSGDGSTTFNLPDARGRVQAGPDGGTSRLNGWGLAQTGGEAAHTMLLTELVAHTHTITDPGHTHTYTPSPNTGGLAGAAGATWAYEAAANSGTSGSSSTGITATNSTGSTTAFNVVQPTLVTNCIIRLK